MNDLRRPFVAMAATIGIVNLAFGFCSTCASTGNDRVGNTTSTSYGTNTIYKKITAANPHNNCVRTWNFLLSCNQLAGTVLGKTMEPWTHRTVTSSDGPQTSTDTYAGQC